MASSTPYEVIHGPGRLYLAPVGTAFPAVNASPGISWVDLGRTHDDQSLKFDGDLVYFRDNDHQGYIKAVRPEEAITLTVTVIGLTLEIYAAVMDRAADVATVTGPPAIKTMPLKRGYIPNEYALLYKGSAWSPYGAFPGQYELFRVVVESVGEAVYKKEEPVGLEIVLSVIENDSVTDADSLGRVVVQTA